MNFTKIHLKNFRGFQENSEIQLAPLTFLVGPNSSGKSSIFDALLLLAQSGFAPSAPTARIPNWQGSLVDLGSYKDTVYRHEVGRDISIVVDVSLDATDHGNILRMPSSARAARFEFRLTCSGRADPIGRLSELLVTDLKSDQVISFSYPENDPNRTTVTILGKRRIRRMDSLPSAAFYFRKWIEEFVADLVARSVLPSKSSIEAALAFATNPFFSQFSTRIQRISSGRLGPRRWYSAMSVIPSRAYRGLYDGIDPLMIEEIRRHDERIRKTETSKYKQKIGRFLKHLDIASEVKDFKLSPYHTAINVRDNVTKVVSNLIDVGYGASQVLPVIVGCLSRSKSPLLVEQPEIHLHPRAQGSIAELLCETSKHRQVMIETHSEHMINRARILVGQGKLSPDSVIINYVSRQKHGSCIEPISILKNGDFSKPWPEGFFDERYNDTMLLLDIKNKRSKKKSL